jgi:hypothetical protein
MLRIRVVPERPDEIMNKGSQLKELCLSEIGYLSEMDLEKPCTLFKNLAMNNGGHQNFFQTLKFDVLLSKESSIGYFTTHIF